MKARHKVDLIGDGISNPFNLEAMIHAAAMFDSACLIRNSSQIDVSGTSEISVQQIQQNYLPVLGLENWKNAQVLYGYELPDLARCAVIAGNEREGISREVATIATQAIIIPMISKRLNCINVAAASAVALFYLTYGLRGRMQVRSEPQKKRPEILLVGGTEHAELGSAIRSSAAFGWNRIFIEDQFNVWFGCENNKIRRSCSGTSWTQPDPFDTKQARRQIFTARGSRSDYQKPWDVFAKGGSLQRSSTGNNHCR
jgi:tRNA G18 (ribose-2'-O)-methylase SpoU